MAAVNANIVVEQTNLAVNPTTNSIGVTVEPINLGVFAGGVSNVVPGGTVGSLQYNFNNTTFAGVANTSVASNGTVTFQNLANLKIAGGSSGYQLSTDGAGVLSWTDATSNANYANFANVANNLNATTTSNVVIGGGTNGYFLQTDGAGALTWNAGTTTPGSANPGGANTQIQYNDAGSFGGTAGFTFNEVTGNVDIPGIYNGDGGGLSNISVTGTKIINGTSNVEIATVDGNVDFTVGSANVARMSTTGAAYPGVLSVNGNINAKNDITVEPGALFVGDGGGLSNVIGANVSGAVSSATTAGTVTSAQQSNITSIGTLTGLGVNGTITASAITANTGLFTGDGGGLSNIAAANVTGLSLSQIANGTSNVDIATADGPITFVTDGVQRAEIRAGVLSASQLQGQFNNIQCGTVGITGACQFGSSATAGGFNGIAIGASASATGGNAISIGDNTSSASDTIAIGRNASATTNNGIAIGQNAAVGQLGISIGKSVMGSGLGVSGGTHIGRDIAGNLSGTTHTFNIGIGYDAGSNPGGDAAIAIGSSSGNNSGEYSIAIGQMSGNVQGQEAIAIGAFSGSSGQGANSIAIGSRAGNGIQAANSIILNATGAALTTSTTDTFNVKPVRSILGGGLPTGFKQVAYNPTTGEFVYYD